MWCRPLRCGILPLRNQWCHGLLEQSLLSIMGFPCCIILFKIYDGRICLYSLMLNNVFRCQTLFFWKWETKNIVIGCWNVLTLLIIFFITLAITSTLKFSTKFTSSMFSSWPSMNIVSDYLGVIGDFVYCATKRSKMIVDIGALVGGRIEYK